MRRLFFLGPSKIDHSGLPKQVHGQIMAAILTHKEFASLIAVGNTPVHGSSPAIPEAHSARLIALGYSGGHCG
jgi:hypothetical protein